MTKIKQPVAPIALEDLSIVDEQYTDGRTGAATKYDAIFEALQQDKRLRCPSGRAGGLACSLRKWLTKRGHKEPLIKSRERCPDGHGGVWWLKEEAKSDLPIASHESSPMPSPATVWRTAKPTVQLKRAA